MTQNPSVEIRVRTSQDSHLTLVVNYLEKNGYQTNIEAIETFKVRFLPIALSAENRLTPEIALSCIAKLKAYIYEIETLAGISPSLKSSCTSEKVQAKDELVEDDLAFLDRMFDIPNS